MSEELHPYYIVGLRPVFFKFEEDGGMDVLAYQWQTGEFARDLNYLSRCLDPTDHEVEAVDQKVFERTVSSLRKERKEAL